MRTFTLFNSWTVALRGPFCKQANYATKLHNSLAKIKGFNSKELE